MENDSILPLIVVCGPTATGKSALAVELCHEIDGEVVSADSMQIYRGMDIGTAKPTEAQRKGIPHHMIDVAEPWEDYSVARYCAEAKKAIRDIAERGKTPVLTGGTGLYIHSLIDHRVFMEGAEDRAYRADLRREACEFGPAHMHEKLRGMDPAAAKRIHPNNLVRVIRAIEIIELTGMTLEEYNRRGREGQSEYNLCMIGLTVEDRGFLYDRIDARVNRMVEDGLIEEVKKLREQRIPADCTAMQGLGYKEFLHCLKGVLPAEETVRNIQRETRRYAKRQLTWFRRDPRIQWLYVDHLRGLEELTCAAMRKMALMK